MHFINDRIGPHIENCLIENLGDDGIAIHGVFGKISGGVAANTRINVYSVSGGDGNFGAEAGDTLIIMNLDYSYNGQAIVRSVSGSDYTLDRGVTAAAGSLIYNSNRTGSGYVIRGCTIRNKRARGILVRGNNGIIENNVIDWTQQASLALFPEYGQWYQSGWARNVKIRNNTFRRSFSFGNTPALTISGGGVTPPAGLFRNIEVTGNIFDSCVNVNLAITSATGVQIRDNVFKNTLLNRNAAVTLRNMDSVVLQGNCLLGPPTEKALTATGIANFTGERDGITFNCAASSARFDGGSKAAPFGKPVFPIYRQGMFSIELPPGAVAMKIYNAGGYSVATLYSGHWRGGTFRKQCALPEGVYFLGRAGQGVKSFAKVLSIR